MTLTSSRPAAPAAHPPPAAAGLDPLTAALLAQAQVEADRVVAAAAAEGRAAVDAARGQVAAQLREAALLGEQDAASAVRAGHTVAARRARAAVLAAQSEALAAVRTQLAAEAARLLQDPGRRQRLAAGLRERLGDPRAVVQDLPDGGLLARSADGRVVVADVAALVDDAVRGLDLEQLWRP